MASVQSVVGGAAIASTIAPESTSRIAVKAAEVAIPLVNASDAHRIMLSQALGCVVSVGSAVVKLPQLLTLLRSQSTVGLSLSMYSVELFSQSIAVLYHQAHGFPLATYGENVSLGAGNMAILACFAKMNRDPRAIVSLFFPLLLSPLVRFPSLLAFLQSLSIPLNIFSKLPQILINYHVAAVLRKQIAKAKAELATLEANGNSATSVAPITTTVNSPLTATTSRRLTSTSTSQLSAVPFALNFLGSFSRLYTTVTQLNGDRLMLVGFLISCALNGAIVAQCWEIARLQREWNEEREKLAAKSK